jgi:hypothetical protein
MGFIKLRKNKQFSYTPRYYDERKERLENMKKAHSDEEQSSVESRMRGKFKRVKARKMPGIFSGATLRTFLILGILVLVVYYLLKKYNLF